MKLLRKSVKASRQRSRPARALWIEISIVISVTGHAAVEAREGLVD